MAKTKKKDMNILWVFGGCGYGKTTFVASKIKELESKNKKVYKLNAKEFVDSLVRNIKARGYIKNFVLHFQRYDSLVLDNVDCALLGKPGTQGVVQEVIQKITDNNKTKVILIGQEGTRKIKNLIFDNNSCAYIHFKTPSDNFKVKLLKGWLAEEDFSIQEDKIKEMIDKSYNLFQLKGLFLKEKLLHYLLKTRQNSGHNKIAC